MEISSRRILPRRYLKIPLKNRPTEPNTPDDAGLGAAIGPGGGGGGVTPGATRIGAGTGLGPVAIIAPDGAQ